MRKFVFWFSWTITTIFFFSIWVTSVLENNNPTYYYILTSPFIILLTMCCGVFVGLVATWFFNIVYITMSDKDTY